MERVQELLQRRSRRCEHVPERNVEIAPARRENFGCQVLETGHRRRRADQRRQIAGIRRLDGWERRTLVDRCRGHRGDVARADLAPAREHRRQRRGDFGSAKLQQPVAGAARERVTQARRDVRRERRGVVRGSEYQEAVWGDGKRRAEVVLSDGRQFDRFLSNLSLLVARPDATTDTTEPIPQCYAAPHASDASRSGG